MIILASASPRRQELLSLICEQFAVEPADIDESAFECSEPEKAPELLAVKKAEHIFKTKDYNDIVIGCDTGVFIDGQMLGKPKDRNDACRMLARLSGRTHKVITGCAIFYKDKMLSFSQTTEVEFYELSQEEIDAYVDTKEPMDKAGAYGIQGKGTTLVKKINGDFYNVVGLPVALLNKKLKEICE
jgi:septum formation protein